MGREWRSMKHLAMKNNVSRFFPISSVIQPWESNLKLKGPLRHKTITSQNVPSEFQVKNFFLS